jgi:outer membrane protein OmpA-like peptidoglycan-associated protein
MRHLVSITLSALVVVACGGGRTGQSPTVASEQAQGTSQAAGAEAPARPEANTAEPAQQAADQAQSSEFLLNTSDAPKSAPRSTASKIKPTRTEAALKFLVLDKDKGPIRGIVVSLTGADGRKYYTEETDAEGYAEVLVPVGQKYELVYLSLGRRDIAANVTVTDEINQTVRLTLRYKRYEPPTPAAPAPQFVLEGVTFDSGKAIVRPESFPRLDAVVEYMTYKKSARIQITGHTDNQGNPKVNKALSQKRAEACRDYLASKGIDKSRIEAVGYGDERPIASNDSQEGRQTNRRIEATEL